MKAKPIIASVDTFLIYFLKTNFLDICTATENKKFVNEINLTLIEKNKNLIMKQKNNLRNIKFTKLCLSSLE